MRSVKKAHLPEKTCAACSRPFAWRKKWERDWALVIYCSERCRRTRTAFLPDRTALSAAEGGTSKEMK